jgi:tRNA (guanine37-N1)-methyltransferase
MLKFDVITLFPQLFEEHLNNLPFKKAIEIRAAEVNLVNLRNFAVDKHGTVDDKPYGGGKGMLLMVEPIYNALLQSKNAHKILLSPKGQKFTQKQALDYSQMKHISLICGRYEGVDGRVEKLVDEVVSIGDFVASGGELPALIIMESVIRLLPGILDAQATENESFSNSNGGETEYPQFTRPEEFKGMKVPEVLLSGNHAKIGEWKRRKRN